MSKSFAPKIEREKYIIERINISKTNNLYLIERDFVFHILGKDDGFLYGAVLYKTRMDGKKSVEVCVAKDKPKNWLMPYTLKHSFKGEVTEESAFQHFKDAHAYWDVEVPKRENRAGVFRQMPDTWLDPNSRC